MYNLLFTCMQQFLGLSLKNKNKYISSKCFKTTTQQFGKSGWMQRILILLECKCELCKGKSYFSLGYQGKCSKGWKCRYDMTLFLNIKQYVYPTSMVFLYLDIQCKIKTSNLAIIES